MRDWILIVDDDHQLTGFLERFLYKSGFNALSVGNRKAMEAELARQRYAAILLDVGLPDADGFDLARSLSGRFGGRILMLTARDGLDDRVLGLDIGADDYITKPFEPRELLARLKAVLRRGTAEVPAAGREETAELLTFDGFMLDPARRSLVRHADGRPVPLTGSEFALLQLLALHAGNVVSRDMLFAAMRGRATPSSDRTVDTHIARLRRKLVDNGAAADLVRTVHRSGYSLATLVQSQPRG